MKGAEAGGKGARRGKRALFNDEYVRVRAYNKCASIDSQPNSTVSSCIIAYIAN